MEPQLHLRPELHAAGYSDVEVRRMLHTGELARVRRGAYLAGELPEDAAARHLLLIRAAVEHLSEDAVVSHASAAVLHGMPVWGLPLDRVHVTRQRRSTGARRGGQVHAHSAPLGDHDIVVLNGVTVTSPARTVIDVARRAPFEQAVVVADGALHLGLVDNAAMGIALQRKRWPGMPAARRVVAFADGRSASPGESRSRVALMLAGIPTPVLQWEVRDRDGGFVGCVDFGWPGLMTVGEFDGRVKYGALVRPGETPADVVYREKLREDALRAEGLAVVRWTWADLRDFAPIAARLRRELARP